MSFLASKDWISTTVSTGIVIYPQHGRNSKDLFTRVDAAMYSAEEARKE